MKNINIYNDTLYATKWILFCTEIVEELIYWLLLNSVII